MKEIKLNGQDLLTSKPPSGELLYGNYSKPISDEEYKKYRMNEDKRYLLLDKECNNKE